MSEYTPTETEIKLLRLRTGEAAETSIYTDEVLSVLLSKYTGDVHAAAHDIWTWKAAAVAGLFDWSADGGKYNQSVLYDRYMAAAEEERKQSKTLCRMIIDPELKEVES